MSELLEKILDKRNMRKFVPTKAQAAWTAWRLMNSTDISVGTGKVSKSKSEKEVTHPNR